MGNALCASLLHACLLRGVTLTVQTEVRRVEPLAGSAHRLLMVNRQGERTVIARHGVVFAGGGFSGSAKPGLIAVRRDGRRFVNEGVSYHAFSRAQYAAGAVPCWLVCDSQFLRRYGLGIIRQGAWGLASALKSGYVKSANTLEALAQKISVDPSWAGSTPHPASRWGRP